MRFEYRFAEGAAERLPALAAELVALRPDVIYTFTTGGADAAAQATSSIAIVVGPASERTMERLAGGFARPVGNVTGLTLTSLEQEQKCLPLVSSSARIAPDGGLLSMGTDHSALVRRAAFCVHRILGGARAADLPVERPTVYKLAVNRKTAAAPGLTIPQALLLRADEVIQ